MTQESRKTGSARLPARRMASARTPLSSQMARSPNQVPAGPNQKQPSIRGAGRLRRPWTESATTLDPQLFPKLHHRREEVRVQAHRCLQLPHPCAVRLAVDCGRASSCVSPPRRCRLPDRASLSPESSDTATGARTDCGSAAEHSSGSPLCPVCSDLARLYQQVYLRAQGGVRRHAARAGNRKSPIALRGTMSAP